jgi:hypothetical protein
MKLTKTQITWLKNSFRNKDTRPTFGQTFWSVRKAWLLAIPLAGFGVWEFVSDSYILGCVLISVAWGNVFASIALSTRAVSLWPVHRDVTRWDRVEELIRDYDDHAA